MDTPQSEGDKILRAAGLLPPTGEAERAKRNLDARLAGLGLPASSGLPTKIVPGAGPRSFVQPVDPGPGNRALTASGVTGLLLDPGSGAPDLHYPNGQPSPQVRRILEEPRALGGAQGAATSLLFDPRGAPPPQVVLSQDLELEAGQASFEPSDLSPAVACTSLATTAAGGTEVKFSVPGIIYIGSGAIGVYWARALGANINSKWSPLLPGMRLAYHPQAAIFFGGNSVGGVTIGGVLTLAFYKMPPNFQKKRDAWSKWHKQIGEWTEGSGSDNAAGAIMGFLGGAGPQTGTDVTLGTFSDAGVGTQIFNAATNMPVGGASARGAAIMNAPNTNTDAVWVAESSVLAVASNNGIFTAGQDQNNVPVGGKLFMLANSGTQKLGVRFRS